MRTMLSILLIAGGMLLAAAPLSAHHAFSAEFDVNKPITLEGMITKMEWLNPHAWLYIEVTDPDGTVVEWALEFGTPSLLYRRGWTRDSLPVGTQVTVQGYVAKDGSPTANAQNVALPDGTNLFAGSAGSPGAAQGGR